MKELELKNKGFITSLELVSQINLFRANECKSELRHDTIRSIIKDEFEEEILSQKILEKSIQSNGGRPSLVYELTLSQAKQVLVRESKFVRKAVIAYIEKLESEIQQNKTQLPDFNNPAEAARAWALEYEAKQEALALAEKASNNVKRLIHDSKTYTSGEIAKELGLRSATELNNILKDKKIQFKQNNTWLLYANYSDLDYTSTKQIVLDNGHITYDRRWTGKGRDFIVELLND